jgi:phosphate/sulfate permease
MILDNYLSFNTKVIIAIIFAGLWIYFRTVECYAMIPSHSLFASIYVMGWVYAYSYDPLFCPIGLSILLFYTKYNNITDLKL